MTMVQPARVRTARMPFLLVLVLGAVPVSLSQQPVEAADIKWVGYQYTAGTGYPDQGSFFHGDNWLN